MKENGGRLLDKKNIIGDIILWSVVILVLINILIAYFSYKSVVNSEEPKISLGVKKEKNTIIYNEGLFKVVVKEDDSMREVRLKLFFLE